MSPLHPLVEALRQRMDVLRAAEADFERQSFHSAHSRRRCEEAASGYGSALSDVNERLRELEAAVGAVKEANAREVQDEMQGMRAIGSP